MVFKLKDVSAILSILSAKKFQIFKQKKTKSITVHKIKNSLDSLGLFL